ncbi:MAG: TolC family protein [Bacteroidota bacterium]
MKLVKLSTFIGLFIIACSSMEAEAQRKWTLEECINYALENNINIKRQKIAAEQARNERKQAKWEMAPSIAVNGSHSFNFGKTINPDNYEYVNQRFQSQNLQANANLNLYNGLETQNTQKMRHYDLMAQLENIETARYNVTLNIVTYYLNVLSQAEQKKIKQEQLDVTMDQRTKTSEQVKVGNKAKGDLLEIKAQAARQRAELTRAQNALKMAYVDLAQLMNLDSIKNFSVIIPENLLHQTGKLIQPVDTIYDNSVQHFPTIQNAKYQLKSSQKYLDIMKGRLLPTLSFRTSYYTYYNELSQPPYTDQIKNINPNLNLQLVLNIPIFDKMRNHNQISNAKLLVKDSKYFLREQKLELFKTIQKAANEAEAAFEEYQSSLESVESSEEAFKYTKEKYDVGLVDAVEYKMATNELSSARSNSANAKYNYIFRQKILEFYMGQEMKL